MTAYSDVRALRCELVVWFCYFLDTQRSFLVHIGRSDRNDDRKGRDVHGGGIQHQKGRGDFAHADNVQPGCAYAKSLKESRNGAISRRYVIDGGEVDLEEDPEDPKGEMECSLDDGQIPCVDGREKENEATAWMME